MPAFPRTKRKIWVWKRETRDLLLKLDPKAKWEKHEARKCHRCGRWMLGLQAQMQRDRRHAGPIHRQRPGAVRR